MFLLSLETACLYDFVPAVGFSCKNKFLSLHPPGSQIHKKNLAKWSVYFLRTRHRSTDADLFSIFTLRPTLTNVSVARETKIGWSSWITHGLIVIYELRYKVLSNATFTVAYTVVKFLPSVLRKVPTDRETTKHGVSRCAPDLRFDCRN